MKVGRLLSIAVVFIGLGGALSSASAQAAGTKTGAGGRRPSRQGHTAVAPVTTGPLTVGDAAAIMRRWGIRIEGMRLTSSGYMLDFRYRVVDGRKARPLFERKTKPVLRDEASGAELPVPVPPKTGALRSSNDPKAGRSYFMFFANPGRFIKAGNKVTVTIGEFSVRGILVADESAAAPSAHEGHEGHEGHEALMAAASTARALAPSRTMTPQPAIGEVPLLDQDGRRTSLQAAIGSDKPVLLNFIFTTCTTICPVMSAGFAQFLDTLGPEREHVRLVSISIDPEIDTVDALRAYAVRFHAEPSWRFLTGTRAAVEAAQRTFGAYRGDKSNHAPATYLRRTPDSPWESLDGLSSADTLLRAFRGGAAGAR